MNSLLKTSLALTLAAATMLAPCLASAQASGEGTPSSGEGTMRDTNKPAGDATSGGQAGSMTNGDNTGEAGGQDNAAANPTPEQQTRIRDLVKAEKAEPAPADADARIGVVIPADSGITLRPLPAQAVKIMPAYANHQYFVMADGRIVILDPRSREVVYVLKG